VNHFRSINSSTGNSPEWTAVGDDANIDNKISAKGTGKVKPQGAVLGKEVVLTPGANVATNASLGSTYTLVPAQNFTLDNPTNSESGQKILYRIKQDGTGSRVMTLGANFRLGTDITDTTLSTAASTVDYMGVVYNSTDAKWDVVLFIKGF